MNATATTTAPAATSSHGRRHFLRHFGEMLAAMLAGMVVLGGAAEVVFAAAGSSYSSASGTLMVLVMGFNMTVPMVAWMSYRGHPRRHNVEMAGSMVVPSLAAAALAAAGALSDAGALAVQHVVMIPAMLGVMLWRYQDYSQPHAHSK